MQLLATDSFYVRSLSPQLRLCLGRLEVSSRSIEMSLQIFSFSFKSYIKFLSALNSPRDEISLS